jgi:signal transduction histidine kinase
MRDHVETERLVEQQAALRRVAMLVAGGASSSEVFDTVVGEIAVVLGLSNAAICRYDDEGTSMTVLAVCGSHPSSFEAGSRWPLDGPSVSLEVLRTGRATRIEDYTDLSGSLAAEARERGFTKVAGAPIVVDGRIWGVVSTSSPDARLPDDLEDRLAEFTELIATAIANSQAHEELAQLAEEQAALRRVATLVAEGAPPPDVFAAVTAEVAQLVGADGSALTRYESDGAVTALGGWSNEGGYVYVGRRYALEGTVSGLIFETGRPGRVESYEDAPGSAPEAARAMGWRSSVGAPITVEGRLWGVLAVISKSEQPLPRATEARLAKFTDLVATAVANTESRDELSHLADEQAALRRVATLVAEDSQPSVVFTAIADEVAVTFGVPIAAMLRYDRDGIATVLATVGENLFPIGDRVPVTPPSITEAVFRTGKAVSRDNWADISDHATELGVHWAVGVPIVVDGALWGLIAVAAPETVSSASQVEPRLAKFTELLATAVSNSEAHERLARLAEEQAALRRVATLVAQGATPFGVFDAVRHEVARMFNVPLTVLMRYDADGMATVLATSEGYLGPIGRRWPMKGDGGALARVRESGRAERVDYAAPVHGAIPDAARAAGVRTAVGVPVEVDGALWGVMAVGARDPEPMPPDIEQRLAKFTELLATAIANAESRAELEASRARVVATADATRRRIERDLHDGAQQQLLSLALEVRAAQAAVPATLDGHRADLSHVAEGLTDVLDGLREIALGIHPAILAEGGLAPALKTLANRSPIPVEIDLRIEGRLPEPVEVAAYYVASEALTNAAKHSQASIVHVAVEIRERVLLVVVRDDGVGGADADGSGLLGLKDRAEAIGGRFLLVSAPGDGTSLQAELPLDGRD